MIPVRLELVREGARDSTGDRFPREVLEQMARTAKCPLPINVGFDSRLNTLQGYVMSCNIEAPEGEPARIIANCDLLPHADAARKALGLELALAGKITKWRQEGDTRVLEEVELMGASLVREKVK